MNQQRKTGALLILLGVLALLAAAGMASAVVLSDQRAEQAGAVALTKLKMAIVSDSDKEAAADLPVIEIDGRDYVGWITLDGKDAAWPVESADGTGDIFPKVEAGNPADGGFILRGPYKRSVFGRLSEVKEDDTITFIQANGAVIRYHVESSSLIARYSDIEENDLLLLCHHGLSGWYVVGARVITE
jgi:sortase A